MKLNITKSLFSKISKIGLPSKEDKIEKLSNQLNFSLFKLEEQLPIEFQKDIKADRDNYVKTELEAKDRRDKVYKGSTRIKRRKTSISSILPTNFNIKQGIAAMNNNDLNKYKSKRSSLNLNTEESCVNKLNTHNNPKVNEFNKKILRVNNKKSRINSVFEDESILKNNNNINSNKISIEFDFYPEYNFEAHKKESFLNFNDDYVLNTNKNASLDTANKKSTEFYSLDIKSIINKSVKSKDNMKTMNYLNSNSSKKIELNNNNNFNKDLTLRSCRDGITSNIANAESDKLNNNNLPSNNAITESIFNYININNKAGLTSNYLNSKEDKLSKVIKGRDSINIIKEELNIKDFEDYNYLETIDNNNYSSNLKDLLTSREDEKNKYNVSTIDTDLTNKITNNLKLVNKKTKKIQSSYDMPYNFNIINNEKSSFNNLNKINCVNNDYKDKNLNVENKKTESSIKFNNLYNNNSKISNLNTVNNIIKDTKIDDLPSIRLVNNNSRKGKNFLLL